MDNRKNCLLLEKCFPLMNLPSLYTLLDGYQIKSYILLFIKVIHHWKDMYCLLHTRAVKHSITYLSIKRLKMKYTKTSLHIIRFMLEVICFRFVDWCKGENTDEWREKYVFGKVQTKSLSTCLKVDISYYAVALGDHLPSNLNFLIVFS